MNSEDRELLELAAKAAGFIELRYDPDGQPRARHTNGVGGPWNPLTDDGDALRLAVKLRVDVAINSEIEVMWWNGDSLMYVTETPGKDLYAATRRAITRAAAEIGRAMP